MALFFEFDFFIKSCRHCIGILAWTWAILVFCLSYIGRGNNHNTNYFHGGAAPPTFYQAVFVPILKVLLVAPSASLAGPIPAPNPTPDPHQAVVLPWGQGLAVGSPISHGGFVYCAGCSPINPQQFTLPANVPMNKVSVIQASGVLPPEQRLNGLGTNEGVAEEPGKGTNIWNDGSVPIQQMALHDDGRYSFSYDTAHSSRQEERNLDGTVQGSYSYTDPEGKVVQIDYTAGPNKGYNAYGENVPPQPNLQLPLPVRDTPEVQEARQRFLETYAAELARIEQDRKEAEEKAAANAAEGEADSTGAPSGDDTVEVAPQPENSDDEGASIHDEDDAVIVSGKSELASGSEQTDGQQQGIVDEQGDAIVISADNSQTENNENGERAQNDENPSDSSSSASLPSPSYQITIPIGLGQNSGLSVQNAPEIQNRQNFDAQPIQPVIGIPQPVVDTPEVQEARQRFIEAYNKELEMIQKAHQEAAERAKNAPISETQTGNEINANGDGNANTNSESAESKTKLQPYFYYISVGGVPHYITSIPQPTSSPYPTSLKATLLGAIPLSAVHDAQVPNRGNQDVKNNNAQVFTGASIQPVFLDLENSNSVQEGQNKENAEQTSLNNQQQSVKVNPILGQLVPLGLTPVNGANGVQIGYIPSIILNNGGASAQNPAEGSQSNSAQSVPAAITLNINVPHQNQKQAASSSNSVPALNQPVILLASKK